MTAKIASMTGKPLQDGGFLERVGVLRGHLADLRDLILQDDGEIENSHDQHAEPGPDMKTHHDAYSTRLRSLEDRLTQLSEPDFGGRDAEIQALSESLSRVESERNQLDWEINGQGGYLSEIQTLRAVVDPYAEEAEMMVQRNAAIADAEAAEEDRDRVKCDNDDLNERLATLMAAFESVVAQRNALQEEKIGLQAQLDHLRDQDAIVEEPEHAEDAAKRTEQKEIRDSDRDDNGEHSDHHTANQNRPPTISNQVDFENQVTIVRSQRDLAIKQNEEARRMIATRTAERNGAHQRIKFLEEQAKEHRDREILLREELRKERDQPEQIQPTRASTTAKDTAIEAGRKEIERLRTERDAMAVETFQIQYDRDTARDELRALGEESAKARAAADSADVTARELRRALDAANHAALAERTRADEARRAQNKLRVEREAVRLEANELRAELAAAHEISLGLVRHGNMSVGELVHIREEKELAVTNAAKFHDTLIQAQEKVSELQKQLDESVARHTDDPDKGVSLPEYNWIIAERDSALARVKELERSLEELEEDYRQNLDQWEAQTQSDEREISASKDRLRDERERTKDLAAKLNIAHQNVKIAETKLREAEVRGQEAENKARAAEADAAIHRTQLQQAQHGLSESQKREAEHEGIRDRLRAECLRLGEMIIAARAEVIRVGGNTIDPNGTVVVEESRAWPEEPFASPTETRRPPVAAAEAIADDPHDTANPFPFPPPRRKSSSLRRKHSILTGVSVSTPRSAISMVSPRMAVPPGSARSHVSFASMHHSPTASHHYHRDSPFPSPGQYPPGRDPVPFVFTGPTMSTQTSPRATRNPAPDYCGKRKTDGPGSDEDRSTKKKPRSSNKGG